MAASSAPKPPSSPTISARRILLRKVVWLGGALVLAGGLGWFELSRSDDGADPTASAPQKPPAHAVPLSVSAREVARFLQSARDQHERAATACWRAVMCGDVSGLRDSVASVSAMPACFSERLPTCLAERNAAAKAEPPQVIAGLWEQLFFLQVEKNYQHALLSQEVVSAVPTLELSASGPSGPSVEDWANATHSPFAARYAELRQRTEAAIQATNQLSAWLRENGVCLPQRTCAVSHVMHGTAGHVVPELELEAR